ncbi:hypothetical protein NHJ13051_008106 [Beauveria bassiana]
MIPATRGVLGWAGVQSQRADPPPPPIPSPPSGFSLSLSPIWPATLGSDFVSAGGFAKDAALPFAHALLVPKVPTSRLPGPDPGF